MFTMVSSSASAANVTVPQTTSLVLQFARPSPSHANVRTGIGGDAISVGEMPTNNLRRLVRTLSTSHFRDSPSTAEPHHADATLRSPLFMCACERLFARLRPVQPLMPFRSAR